MMGALQHSPAPAGLPPIFAALGLPGSPGSDLPAFDQLVAAAPMPVLADAKPGVALPLPAQTLPVVATPVQPIADAAVAALPAATPAEAAPETMAAHDDAATKAATLLLAAAAGQIAAPVAGQVAAQAGAAVPRDTPASKPAATTPAKGDADAKVEPSVVTTDGNTAPTVAWTPAPALAASAASPAHKPGKPADTAPAAREGDAPAPPVAARPRDTAQAAALTADFLLPKAKVADAGPSMTVVFAQPAAQAAAAIAEAAPMAPVTERVLDMGSDDAWIDQLARDIAATKSQGGDISFRLMPRHLGRLDVAMRQEEGGVSLKLDTQHEATATIVHAAQGRLVEDLRQQGVRVAGAEVTCTPGETGRHPQQGAQQGTPHGQGRGAAHDPAHLIETAPERAEPRDEERAATRGRFA